MRCRPYATFRASRARQIHQHDHAESVTHWVSATLPWDEADPATLKALRIARLTLIRAEAPPATSSRFAFRSFGRVLRAAASDPTLRRADVGIRVAVHVPRT